MAKPTDKQWAKAKALYGNGKSLREIEKAVGIPYKTVEYRAKKEGWSSTEVARAIQDKVRVEAAILHMDVAQQEIVQQEVQKQLEGMQFYSKNARIVAKIALKTLTEQPCPMNAKTTMATLKEGLIVEGLVPFYPNAQMINNTNAQQNILQISGDDSSL